MSHGAGSKRHLIDDPFQLTATEMRLLLDDLDERLRAKGIAASVYVVGGAAMALTGEREALTPDVDVVTSTAAIWDEAAEMADEYGLPTRWINDSAAPYVPPRPAAALVTPTQPGLTVHIAPDDHRLAMKLVAARAKDRPDIERLIRDLGMENAEPADYASLLERVYDGEGRLGDVLGVPGGEPDLAHTEATRIGESAVRVARSAKARENDEPS